jgi:hypothetical protein
LIHFFGAKAPRAEHTALLQFFMNHLRRVPVGERVPEAVETSIRKLMEMPA